MNQRHFVVVYDIKKSRKGYRIFVADPVSKKIVYSEQEFKKCWISTKSEGEDKGIVLLLEPSPEFYAAQGEKINRNGFGFLIHYVKPHKGLIIQLTVGLALGSLLQLVFPFLTQNIVDVGIGTRNIQFVWLVLIAQLVLTISTSSVNFIRGWILLHLGTRINISLIILFCI